MSSEFQNRLFQFEEEPSPKVWDNIVAALGAEEQFPQRLYNYEEEPKQNVWQNIADALTEKQPAKVFEHRRLWRYSGVAAILILVVASTVLLLNKKPATENSVAISNQPAKQRNSSTPEKINQVTPGQQTIVATIQSNEPKHSKDKKFISFASEKQNVGEIEPETVVANNVTPECLIADVKNKIKHLDLNTDDRFMVYCCDKNGNPIRIPKKVYDAVSCAEVDASCKQNIQCLQEKISGASLSTDFIGVLQIIKQVQENQ